MQWLRLTVRKVTNLGELEAKTFEPAKLPDRSTQKGSLQLSRPTWLDKWNDFRSANWLRHPGISRTHT